MKKFQTSKFYRHPNNIDVDIYIIKSSYRIFWYKLKVLYWNRNYNNFILPNTDVVYIKSKDVNKWKQVTHEIN